jgi:hypothetical protein
MQLAADFNRIAQLPASTAAVAVEQGADLIDHALDIDDGMAGKHLGQTVGQVTRQAFTGSLVQFQIENKPARLMLPESEPDIVGPFGRIAQQGIKELIGTAFGKKRVERFTAKEGGQEIFTGCHGRSISAMGCPFWQTISVIQKSAGDGNWRLPAICMVLRISEKKLQICIFFAASYYKCVLFLSFSPVYIST